MTGETPNPLDGDPITTLRELWEAWAQPERERFRAEFEADAERFHDSLARVAALAEAAQAALAQWRDFAQNSPETTEEMALRAALVPFAAHKDTNHA